MNKLKILIFVFAILLINLSPLQLNAFSFDPFDRYGKWLPWGEWEPPYRNMLVLTVSPQQHLSGFHGQFYYSQNFAANGGSLGIPVRAISDAVVKTVGNDPYYWGLYVDLDHQNGYISRYSHLQFHVLNQSDIGKAIRQGQEIGGIGGTGDATSPNLEFTMYDNQGRTVNPMQDSRPFQGTYSLYQFPYESYITPINTFDVNPYAEFFSNNDVRPADPGNPWDPPVIDPLDRYLQNYGYLFPNGMIAEPVNTALGSFVHKNSDLEFPETNGHKFSFERYYNSPDNFNGMLGRGWDNSFNIKLMAHEDHKFSIKLEDGRGEIFQELDSDPNTLDQTFNNLTPESKSTLTRFNQTNNYKFQFTTQDKTNYVFYGDKDSGLYGNIDSITYLDGTKILFSYNSTGDLTRVTDVTNNRYFDIVIGSDNLLHQVKGSDGKVANYEYNFDGRLSNVIKANNGAFKYTYDSLGQITSITDANGIKFVENTYDTSNRVVSQKDGNGGITTFEYYPETNFFGLETGNSITKIKDPLGQTTTHIHNLQSYLVAEIAPNGDKKTYEYNSKGQKTKEILADGSVYDYAYDANGNQTSYKDPIGYTKSTEYNSLNLPTKTTDNQGVLTNEYNAGGKVTKITDHMSQITEKTYNILNQLISEKDPNGNVKEYTYDANGNVAAIKDPSNNAIITNTYDASGNKTSTKDSLNRVSSFEYSALNKSTKITDPKGNIKTFEYDSNGNLIKETDAKGLIKKYVVDGNENIIATEFYEDTTLLKKESTEYDANNNKIKFTDANGNVTKYSYDSKKRITKQDSYAGDIIISSISYAYNSRDFKTSETNGNGITTYFEYDVLGNKTKVINPSGVLFVPDRIQTFKYDIVGNLIEQSDFEGNLTKYEYDSINRKIKEIDALGTTTTFEYDKNGNQIKQKTNDKLQIANYDSANRKISETNANGSIQTFVYNQVGNLISTTNFAGEVTTFAYDNNDNKILETDGTGNVTSFEYDSNNNLIRKTIGIDTEEAQASNWITAYDVLNRKVRETTPLGQEKSYTYDKNGNLITLQLEDGTTTTFEYDALNRKVKETNAASLVTTYEYDANSNIIKSSIGNLQSTMIYDRWDRKISETNALGDSKIYTYSYNNNLLTEKDELGYFTTYTYDKLNRKLSTKNALNNTSSVTYDSLGRKTSGSDFAGNFNHYEYDLVGNLIKSTDRLGTITTFEYDGNGKKIKSAIANQQSTISYDTAGRISKEINAESGETKYTYDIKSNIKTITDPKGNITTFEYDLNGNKYSETNALGGKKIFAYDGLGRLIKETDENGNSKSYQFDVVGNLAKTTDGNGNQTDMGYDIYGNLIYKNNSRTFQTKYEYDALNRLVKTIEADSAIKENTYDKKSQLIQIKDYRGNISKKTYDAIGNLLSEVDPIGNTNFYEYDANSNITKTIDRSGASSNLHYDLNDQLVKKTNPNGEMVQYTYDALGRIIEEKGTKYPQSNPTTYEYDVMGRRTKVTDPLGTQTLYTYDKNGNLVQQKTNDKLQIANYDSQNRKISETNPEGGIKTYGYDAVGNVIAEADENGNITTYTYDRNYNKTGEFKVASLKVKGFTFDANNNLASETDANGNSTIYEYDSRDRKSKEILPGGETTNYEYDANNNLVKTTTPKGTIYSSTYDSRNLVISKTDPENHTTKYEYDKVERVSKEIDAKNQATEYTYDAVGRLLKVRDAIGLETKYTYDTDGNLLTETNANNKVTTYTYNSISQKLSEKNPLGNETKYEYDIFGNVIKQTNPNADVINFTYDKLDRVTLEDYANVATNVNYAYDAVGNLTSVKKGDITNTFVYDKQYRIIQANDSRGVSTKYTLDNVGNKINITYPDGKIVSYTYNRNNKVTSLSTVYAGDSVAQRNPITATTTFEYDANLKLVKQSNPNNTEIINSYDNADRLTRIKNVNELAGSGVDGLISESSYELDTNGDRVKETIVQNDNNVQKTQVKNYTYDANRRLTKVVALKSTGNGNLTPDYTENYTYDNAGNRTKLNKNGSITNYTYNAANQLTSDSKFTYGYNPNGDRYEKVSKNTDERYSYTYDKSGNLIYVDSQIEDINYLFQYKYDGLNRRVEKLNETDYSSCDWPCYTKPMAGIDKVDYYYNEQSFDALSETYFRQLEDPDSGVYPVHSNFLLANIDSSEPTLIATQDYDDAPVNEINYIHQEQPEISAVETDLEEVTQPEVPSSYPGNFVEVPASYPTDNLIAVTETESPENELITQNAEHITQRLSYYHRDGLGSILGRSSLSSSPTVVKLTNNYNAYGINTRNSNVNLYPQIDGFAEWDNKTYSQNEFDYETGTNYYGSRYYEPTTGVWTQQDKYRGNTSTPMSRHRYMFVNDNPVNNKDLYGFSIFDDIGNAWNSGLNWVGDQISSLVAPQNYSYEVTVSYDNSAAINQLNSAKGQLQNNLSTLQQQSNSDWWSAHFASVEMNNYIGMTGIIGRLQRRGYDLDYGQVYNYLGNQAAYHQAIYNSKLNTYYNTLSLIDQAKAGIESYNSKISSTPLSTTYSYTNSVMMDSNAGILLDAAKSYGTNLGQGLLSIPFGFIDSFVKLDLAGSQYILSQQNSFAKYLGLNLPGYEINYNNLAIASEQYANFSNNVWQSLGVESNRNSEGLCIFIGGICGTKQNFSDLLNGKQVSLSQFTYDTINAAIELSIFKELAEGGIKIGGNFLNNASKTNNINKEISTINALRKLTKEEELVLNELIKQGNKVSIVPTSNIKTPDFIVNGIPTELKSVVGNSPTTIKNAIQNAIKQGTNIIIDARNTNFNEEEIMKQILRAQGNTGDLTGKITVITKSNTIKY